MCPAATKSKLKRINRRTRDAYNFGFREPVISPRLAHIHCFALSIHFFVTFLRCSARSVACVLGRKIYVHLIEVAVCVRQRMWSSEYGSDYSARNRVAVARDNPFQNFELLLRRSNIDKSIFV